MNLKWYTFFFICRYVPLLRLFFSMTEQSFWIQSGVKIQWLVGMTYEGVCEIESMKWPTRFSFTMMMICWDENKFNFLGSWFTLMRPMSVLIWRQSNGILRDWGSSCTQKLKTRLEELLNKFHIDCDKIVICKVQII